MNKPRWGFHPCSRELFLKLKLLHKLYWANVRKRCAYLRWERKQPQNRRTPRPEFVAGFETPLCFSTEFDPPRWRQAWEDHCICRWYREARAPSSQPVADFADETIEAIDHYLRLLEGRESADPPARTSA